MVSSIEPSRPEESIAELMVESRAGAAEESRSRWELSALPYESSSSEMVKHDGEHNAMRNPMVCHDVQYIKGLQGFRLITVVSF